MVSGQTGAWGPSAELSQVPFLPGHVFRKSAAFFFFFFKIFF